MSVRNQYKKVLSWISREMKITRERKISREMKISLQMMVYLGMLTAVVEAGKMALTFLPNIEVVTLLLVLYALTLGWKTIYVAVVFTILECFVWGFGLWTISYFYIWIGLVVLVCLWRKQDSVWFWSIFSGIFGLFFGAMCAIPYLFIGGIHTAFAWWVAGIPYDLVHCVGNFVLMLVLYHPVLAILRKLTPTSSIFYNTKK